MIHYSAAGLPEVHKYGDHIFHVLYTAVFELKMVSIGRIMLNNGRSATDKKINSPIIHLIKHFKPFFEKFQKQNPVTVRIPLISISKKYVR